MDQMAWPNRIPNSQTLTPPHHRYFHGGVECSMIHHADRVDEANVFPLPSKLSVQEDTYPSAHGCAWTRELD